MLSFISSNMQEYTSISLWIIRIVLFYLLKVKLNFFSSNFMMDTISN